MELNFLFGNPVKGKKGGKGMAAKKHVRKANPKRRSGGRKNPVHYLNKKTGKKMEFYTGAELVGMEKRSKELVGFLTQAAPSKYSAAEKALMASVAGGYYLPGKAPSKKTVDALQKKIQADTAFVDAGAKSALSKIRRRLVSLADLGDKAKSAAAKKKALLGTIKSVKSKRSLPAAAKMKSILQLLKQDPDLDTSKLSLGDFEQIAKNMKSGNPGKGGKKMAKQKKKAKKKVAPAKRKKSKGKKAAKRKVSKAKGRKPAKRKGKRKVRPLKYSKVTARSLSKAEKSARKYFKKHKKAKLAPKKGRKVSVRYMRSNPGIKETAMSIAKIAAAGAAAGVVLQLANKFAKPMIDKMVPKALADLKVGNAPVGQIALSCLIPGLAAAGLRMLKHPMAQQISDVIIVTTAANAGQRLVAGLLPAGMAGVEPMLMGVEPSLMGEADFGEADFGEADFGRHMGEVQMYGAEPVLMGSGADFGAVEQFSGYGAIQQYSGYGAVEQFSGDEEYAGEDIDGEDFDGESDFGLG